VSVKLVTELAWVDLPPDVTIDQVITAIEELGYTARLHADAPAATALDGDSRLQSSLQLRLIVCSILTVPVVLVSLLPALEFRYWQWMCLVVSTPVITWGAWPFHLNVVRQLIRRRLTIDTLLVGGLWASYLWSLQVLFFTPLGRPGARRVVSLMPRHAMGADFYFATAAAITVFMLASRYVELWARRRAVAKAPLGSDIGVSAATVIRDGAEVRVPVEGLEQGDRVVVRSGERIAADGVVVDGQSSLDISAVMGESAAKYVEVGDLVWAGTLNVGPPVVVEATRVGADTELARMTRLVQETQARKGPIQRRADRVATWMIPGNLLMALLTLIGWWMTGHPAGMAVTAAVAVLVAACPAAIGLATPLALKIGSARGAELGIFFKDWEGLAGLRRVDTVVLDKPGTVTKGQLELTGVHPLEGQSKDEVLLLGGALTRLSPNPVSQAVAHAAEARFSEFPAVENLVSLYNRALAGIIDGREVYVGRIPWVAAKIDQPLPPELAEFYDQASERGRSMIGVVWDNKIQGLFEIGDAIRETSAEAVAEFANLGLRTVLVTGDNDRAARVIANEVGIREVSAEVMSYDKARAVRDLQSDGSIVALVGDGISDAAALAQADLGIVVGPGTAEANAASHISLLGGDLRTAVDAVRLCRRIVSCIRSNLVWSVLFYLASVPLAALGYFYPLVCGITMAFSWIFVSLNSLRLYRFQPLAGDGPVHRIFGGAVRSAT
jgi:Cu+-exporting ATPase